MALQTLEGDLIPMRPAKETLTRYAVLLLGAAILSFGLFNVHSQSGVTEGGVLGTTLLLHHWSAFRRALVNLSLTSSATRLAFVFWARRFSNMPSRRARASPAFICCGSVSARFCQTFPANR